MPSAQLASVVYEPLNSCSPFRSGGNESGEVVVVCSPSRAARGNHSFFASDPTNRRCRHISCFRQMLDPRSYCVRVRAVAVGVGDTTSNQDGEDSYRNRLRLGDAKTELVVVDRAHACLKFSCLTFESPRSVPRRGPLAGAHGLGHPVRIERGLHSESHQIPNRHPR